MCGTEDVEQVGDRFLKRDQEGKRACSNNSCPAKTLPPYRWCAERCADVRALHALDYFHQHIGIDLGAIVERETGTELEGPRPRAHADLPTLSQGWLEAAFNVRVYSGV